MAFHAKKYGNTADIKELSHKHLKVALMVA